MLSSLTAVALLVLALGLARTAILLSNAHTIKYHLMS